ncbi:hypothetical protein [Tenggerimyces flavus]|uniref:Uncharacterized protein n=1 Tax=Tenggerimyces flavus TaxID=1708749 RepID=A0ABV7Y853_9ACTN|nr:hypothetical protein [Tenggerimyces flavus]MBM7788209.1 hypothetical protein [Tenggerimyces flavus]
MAPEQPTDQRIGGTFCRPAGGAAPRTVQVLVPGGYYSQSSTSIRPSRTGCSRIDGWTTGRRWSWRTTGIR